MAAKAGIEAQLIPTVISTRLEMSGRVLLLRKGKREGERENIEFTYERIVTGAKELTPWSL